MSLHKIQKRNGAIVDFDVLKIQNALFSAVKSVGGCDKKTAQSLAKKTVVKLEIDFSDRIPTVEDAQDYVEKILIEEGHAQTAKAYILYREKKSEIRSDKAVTVEVEKTISEYLNKLDWRVTQIQIKDILLEE